MRGKLLFNRLKPLIKIFVIILGFFPEFLIKFLWDCSSIFGNKISIGFRYVLLKTMTKSMGDNIYVGKYVVIKNPKNLVIGNNVSIHDYTYIDAAGGLEIGNDVSIAHNCSILTTNHQWNDYQNPIKYNKETHGKVIIKDDVWLGCGVRVLSDVTLNKRCVVAAGAVVNKNVETNSLVGGVPAKLIKSI